MILKTSRPYLFFLNSIKWKVLAIVVLAVFVGWADDVLYTIFDFDLAIPAFLGTAIVLVLAFRTNKAYMRWWEAKMIWEEIANNSRSWFRMVLKFMEGQNQAQPEANRLRRHLINRQIAWNYVLTSRLREKPPFRDVADYLDQADLAFLEPVDNATQGILFLQSRDLKVALDRGWLGIYTHIELEEILLSLEMAMGKAERIKKTHFPVLYDMLTQVSIFIFCALLTYAIRDSTTVFEAAFAILISTLFLGLDEIARDMQDPFEDLPTDTPMLAISHQIEREALEMLKETEMPQPPTHGSFYLI